MKMHFRSKKVRLLFPLCAFFIFLSISGQSFAEEDQKTIIDTRDIYLDLEALCGVEGMPYEFTTPPKEHVKTKIDPRDIYLDMEAMCGSEGFPYQYMIIPSEYIKVKHQPEDLDLDLEDMLTEDPSVIKE